MLLLARSVILIDNSVKNIVVPLFVNGRNNSVDAVLKRRSAQDWDRRGLPAWTYHSPAMLELEKQELFRNHWQIAGHVSDVPPGRFLHRRHRR